MSNDNQIERIFVYENISGPNSQSYRISFTDILDILGNESEEFEIQSFDQKEIENDNHQDLDYYLSEANTLLNRIADSVYDNNFDQIMEERMMTVAMNESLDYYKTQERKPNIELGIKSEKASDKHVEEKCAICKEDFELEENITSLVCNHILHTDCIREWVKYKSECPVCRKQIQTIDTLENKY